MFSFISLIGVIQGNVHYPYEGMSHFLFHLIKWLLWKHSWTVDLRTDLCGKCVLCPLLWKLLSADSAQSLLLNHKAGSSWCRFLDKTSQSDSPSGVSLSHSSVLWWQSSLSGQWENLKKLKTKLINFPFCTKELSGVCFSTWHVAKELVTEHWWFCSIIAERSHHTVLLLAASQADLGLTQCEPDTRRKLLR